MFYQVLFLFLGLGFLVLGADWLVRGASRLAVQLKVSPLVIGLTIVAFGTSSPELMVNISSVLTGQDDIALGNVVGSNIFNVLFILGACALILPLWVESKLIRWDFPIMIGASGLLYLFCLDHTLSFWEGLFLFVGIGLYIWSCFSYSKKESVAVMDEFKVEYGCVSPGLGAKGAFFKNLVLIVLGLVVLVIGSKWLVQSSVALARLWGLSELVIALTIVAAGTSLPEVATSIMATIKGERDIAIGNVVGSNIFNILAILGISALISGDGLRINPNSLRLDLPFMFLTGALCYPIIRSGSTISRGEGLFFFLLYIWYTLILILSNT